MFLVLFSVLTIMVFTFMKLLVDQHDFLYCVNCFLSHNIRKNVSDLSSSLCFSIFVYLDILCRLSNSRSSPRMKWTGSKKFSSSSEKKEEEVSKKKVMPMKTIYTVKAHCFLHEGLKLWF